MARLPEDNKLTVEIKNTRPIELVDLTESLLSLGDEYKRFVAANSDFAATQNVRLYIKEIRTGSVVADVVALAAIGVPIALPYIENTVNILDFARYLKAAYGYLTGKEETRPELQKQDYTNLSKIIEPVAKDNGAQFNIHASDSAIVQVTFNINSTEANAAQNKIRREIEQFRETETRIYNQVVLYWHQARPDPRSQVGDRAIIESIAPYPVKTVFEDERAKVEMILGNPNPFRFAYIVDVFVETIKGKPALYKITNVHEPIERLDESG